MAREFWNNFSPENQRTFQTLSIPRLQTLAPKDDCAPRAFLHSAGLSSLEDVIDRRHRAYPIDLGSIGDDGAYSPFRARLHGLVKDFFLGESIHLERHRGREHLSRRPPQHLDVRPVGSCKFPSTGDTIQLFCCRYGETQHTERNPYESSWAHRDETLHPRDIHLAIPSRAGLTPPDAVSLVNPLRMAPREYLEDGEAGAVFACTEGMPGFIADLYWSESAFIESLNRVQEIGRKLIGDYAIMRASVRGTGECEFQEPSAILSKLYESAAQFGQTQEIPLFAAGIWGVAVHKHSRGTFACQMGVVGIEVNYSSQEPDKPILPNKERCFAIINFILARDEFGFLSITPDRYTRMPLGDLPWYDTLPELS
jgi:hypothetical protein